MTDDDHAEDAWRTEFDVLIDVADGGAVVRIVGELEMATAPHLRDALTGLLAAPQRSARITLELSQASFIDSSGLSVIVAAFKRAAAQGSTMTLMSPSPAVRRVLDMTGINDLMAPP